MNKVLILSCSTGQGHDSCAKAVKNYFDEQKVCCDVRDALEFNSEFLAKIMEVGHSFIYRHIPGLFKWGYQYSENHPEVFKESSTVFKILTSGIEKISTFIKEGQYDVVLCTHVFSALILTEMMKKYPVDIKSAFVATDYTCSPSMDKSDLDLYFIPHESLKDEFVECGVPRERIVATGIPIRQEFLDHVEKNEAKRRVNVNPDNKHMLIMCGSMGCGPLAKTVDGLAKKMPQDMEVTVVCGTNKKLAKKLDRKHRNNEKVHVVGYTDKISLLMDAADLYLTKPGGISSTEAAIKKLPMLLADVVAGCELHNMRFFEELGVAIIERNLKELDVRSIELIGNEEKLKQMKVVFEKYDQPAGAQRIFESLI